MRLKFLLVISAAYLILISVILYLGLQRETGREEFWIKENSAFQLHSLNDNVGLEIEKLKVEAVKVATAMEANQKEDAAKALGHFAGVAALASESDDFIWKIDSAKSDIWNGPWLQRAKEIPESENQPRFFAIQTQDEILGSVIRSVVFFSAKIKEKGSAIKKTVRLVGILAQPLFQNLLASQQSAGLQFFIFSQKGLAIAHSVSDYVGNSLAGDKLYEEIKKNKVAMGSASHKDFKGNAVVSMYEKIEHTDLTVVAQLRPSQWSVIDWGYYGQTYMVIFGIFAILTGAMFFIIPKEIGKTRQIVVEKIVERIVEKPVEKTSGYVVASLSDTLPKLTPTSMAESNSSQLGFAPAIPAHIYEKMVRSAQLEEVGVVIPKPSLEPTSSTSGLPTKMSIFAKVISQIKAPFLSILGHVQIAKANPQGGSLQAIENEARSAREILDRLAQFSGLSQVPSATVSLLELVDGALRSFNGPILRGAIKVNKNISEDLFIKCDPDDFKMALTAVFRNSIEAMERVLKKELNIEAFKVNNIIQFSIIDTGEGILPRNMLNLFEPFYSTKSPLDHKGLGLAAVQGIMRTHLAEVTLSSDPDRGTVVKITIPVSLEAPKQLVEIQMLGRPAWMDLIKTPSRQDLIASESLLEPIEIQKVSSNTEGVEIPEKETSLGATYNIDQSEIDFELMDFKFNDGKAAILSESTLETLAIEIDTRPKSIPPVEDHGFLENSLLFASPVKRLKKKAEPLDKLKVQIPRPEEKL